MRSAHLQTLWPVLFKPRLPAGLRRERLELDDGDFLDLCWLGREDAPVVLLLHGLEGGIDSHYIRGVMPALQVAGFQALLMHFRGCSGEPNRLPRAYHSGETGDLQQLVAHVHKLTGKPPYAAVGYSLGGNVLLKWLGETGSANPLQKAVAVSVPFRLQDAAARLEQGASKIYRDHLLKSLRRTYHRKFSRMDSPLQVDVEELKSFWDYDDKITAPLHGFDGAEDYYRRCSSRQFLKHIRVATRIIHAQDDPFMFASTVPSGDELSDVVELLLCRHGGHVGFLHGRSPWTLASWSEAAIRDFLLP